MKKLISILLAVLMIAATALTLTGCDTPAVSVSSELKLVDTFRGSRVVTIRYPLSANIDAIKDTILDEDPTASADGVSFAYNGVEEDGYYFELSFTFRDQEEYESQVAAVIGRPASAFLSRKDTALTKGTRMAEDFDVADLIAWITRATAADASTRELAFRYDTNTVTIGSDTFTTGSTVEINQVEGSTVNSVSIRTSNDKQGHYDRTFIFSIPNQTYIAAQDAIEQYFLTDTASSAKYYGWSAEGTNMLYTVIFESLSLRDLKEVTALLLDTENVSIAYGDLDNASTPLSEGFAFEENLDTFSFIGSDKGAPTLSYSYSLPTSTIHSDGTVFEDGQWVTRGVWEEGVYKLELNSGSLQLRVPDGIQYAINGIDFRLESLGDERFRRTTSFLYSKTDGYDGMTYAQSFFTAKGAVASTGEDEDNLICSVACEGTTAEITAELVRLFGSGNFMAYRTSSGPFSLTTKTSFTDYISLGSILNSTNANRPMRYYVSAAGGENIVSLILDGSETAYTSPEQSYLTLNGSTATVEYRGNIPITSHIVIYVLVGLLLLGATVGVVVMMLRRRRPRLSPGAQEIVDAVGAEDDGDSEVLASLAQTTTFSIAELGALSRNKRYVEEINQDIEKRMEADRLNERKKEIRQKELEEIGRKVYGTTPAQPADPAPPEEPGAPAQTSDDTEADADREMDYATGILTEAAAAGQDHDLPEEPADDAPPAADVDPFELLDEAADEEDSDDQADSL